MSSSLDLFNIDSKCKIQHCSIVILCFVLLACFLVLALTVWCWHRRRYRRIMIQQSRLDAQVQTSLHNQPSQILRTEESLQPRISEQKNLNNQVSTQEISSQQLYKFEESNIQEETKQQTKQPTKQREDKRPEYITELMKQIEIETMEIQKISIRRKRKKVTQKRKVFSTQPPTQQTPLDTIQQQIPSLCLSSIQHRPTSPMSFSFNLEHPPMTILQHPNQNSES